MADAVFEESLRQDRRTRDALVEAMHRLDLAWMAPQCGRHQPWQQLLAQRMQEVVRLLEEHAAQLEAPQGLINSIAQQEPRLLDRIERLRQEHHHLLQQARQLQQQMHQPPLRLREQVGEFLRKVREHHAKENDLIYEAVQTDIGTGD